ncbi:hypothetical protein EDD11_006386 [Mortierella claussenii]|nr:hypothetical protein EDD11_006386 [Mortierella claussenii]
MKTLSLNSTENSQLIASKDLQYTLSYFAIHFAGASARGILAYAGADWKPIYPNWGAEKPLTPFERLPVLTIIHPNSGEEESQPKELHLAENVAIDMFLAKQFGFHGNDAWEEALINAYYSNSNIMFFQEIMNNYFWTSVDKSDEEKKKYLDTLLNEQLSDWARIHEGHLENNHLNGHYVGNRTTLPDIRTTTMLDALEKIIGKERLAIVVNETKTPGIIKVRHTIESKPSYSTWINSDEYKKLDVKSTAFVKDHHPELLSE